MRPPPTTALGGLLTHLGNRATKDFQPSNINFGLLPPFAQRLPKKQRGLELARRALRDLTGWMGENGLQPSQEPPTL